MKLLIDFFPILLFFLAYKMGNMYIATGVAMAAAIAQTLWIWIRQQRLEAMNIITVLLITILGGATLFLHNELFIKWKPTAINWVFAIAFLGSQFFGEKPLLQRMLDQNISLPKAIWLRMNLGWVGFFLLSGFVNLYVVYHFDDDTWVNFKLFGLMGMTILFAILQAIYMARYLPKHSDRKTLD